MTERKRMKATTHTKGLRHPATTSMSSSPHPDPTEEQPVEERGRAIELGEPEKAWGAAYDQEGVFWLTCNGLPLLDLTATFKKAAEAYPFTANLRRGLSAVPEAPEEERVKEILREFAKRMYGDKDAREQEREIDRAAEALLTPEPRGDSPAAPERKETMTGERITHVITEDGVRYQRTGEERVPRELEDYLDPNTGNVYSQNDAAPETRKRTILRRVSP